MLEKQLLNYRNNPATTARAHAFPCWSFIRSCLRRAQGSQEFNNLTTYIGKHRKTSVICCREPVESGWSLLRHLQHQQHFVGTIYSRDAVIPAVWATEAA